MKRQTRDRLLLPILLPVGILVVLAAVLYGFSRILLATSANAATATALAVAASIVVASAVVAGRRSVRVSSLVGLVGAVTGVAMIVGGLAIVAIGTEGEGGPAAEGPGLNVVAQDIAFDTDTLELTADTPTTITFENRDAGVQHNIAIYEDDTLETVLFQGELITGPETVEYQIPPLPAGEYYFHCDVHPNMNGTVVVGEGAGPPETPAGSPEATGPAPSGPSEGGGDVTTEVVAQGIAFDVTEIVLPAGQESTIHFVNNDAGVQHNIVIATDPNLTEQLFSGELITGPTETDYTVPPLEPGEYYFLCIVHPNMNGIVTVR
jgi:plastocyanin